MGAARTYPVAASETIRTMVVHCSDPRFGPATDAFLEAELNIKKGEYVPIVVAGGIASLARPLELPKEFKFMKDTLALFFQHFHRMQRVVLIAHEDCKKYAFLSSLLKGLFLKATKNVSERQMQDLVETSRTVQLLAGHGVEVERYFAHFADAERTQIAFDRIGANK